MTTENESFDGFFVFLRDAVQAGRTLKESLPQIKRILSSQTGRKAVLDMGVRLSLELGRQRAETMLQGILDRLRKQP